MQNIELNFNSIGAGFYDSQFVYKKTKVSPERVVDCYEFEYFPQSGGIAVINGKTYPIEKGTVLFAAPGCHRHSVLHFKAYYIHCRTDNAFLKEILNGLPNMTDEGEDAVKMESLFKQVIWCSRSEDSIHWLYAEAKLLELICNLSHRTGEAGAIIYNPMIVKGMEFIGRNYGKDIKLDDMAKEVGLTPVYFHNLFLKNVGQTPHQYLLEKRLSMARELLSSSDMSLVNIAGECGFSSQSYFNSIFKKHCGTTPLKYRQNAFVKYPL